MKEIHFLQKNKSKWQMLESIINSKKAADPDKLSDLYIQVMDDLAYARTYFPKSATERYLNGLSAKIHFKVYRNKKENKDRFKKFWLREIPLLFGSIRNYLLISLLIFAASITIGALSSANDPTFSRLILSDGYVEMTLNNIEKGDPMAVYKQSKPVDMFLRITFNNIFVSFWAFVLGSVFTLGTVYVLLTNGIMLGTFHYLFYEHGLLLESLRVVWIHGTLEITAIIVAGAAGLILGSGFLFPGTYPRMYSFRKGAKKGTKVVVGLIPVFILAGLFESFLTRMTYVPMWASVLFISACLAFVIFYFVIYPRQVERIYEDGKNSA